MADLIKFEKKEIAGAVILLVILSTLTLSVVDIGQTKKCYSGWQLVTSGDHAGQYVCQTNPDNFYYCFNVRDTNTGRVNYYCDIGELKKPELEIKEVKFTIYGNGVWYTVSPNGVYCYPYGNLRLKQEC